MNTVTEGRSFDTTTPRFIQWAGLAGIVGPVVFTVGFLVQQQLRREDYDWVKEVVSALEAGDQGWVP